MRSRSSSEGFVRQISTVNLTLSGVGCIIGSGWLFGAYHAAELAGPSSVFSWVIGGVAILLVALTVAELGTMFPKSGGMVRYMEYANGSFAGFMTAWANWLAIVTVIPAEAAASVQYLSAWRWPWAQGLFEPVSGQMTASGLAVASVLILIYFLLNFWTLTLFLRSMAAITVIKIVTPFLTVLLFFLSGFHSENFTLVLADTHSSWAPYGWSGMLTAVSTCGIVFAFNGFQTPVNLAGEAKNPSFSVPVSMIASIALCLVLYVLLQIAFVGAVPPAWLRASGWSGLDMGSPFVQLAMVLNLNLLVTLLYFDAFLSPSGTAVSYMATTTRMLYGMQRNGYMPRFIGRLHKRYVIPRGAMWVNLAVSYVCLFMFKGWGHLAEVISVATVFSYFSGPVAVMGLRRVAPHFPRPVRVPGMSWLAPVCFVFTSLVFYWSRWPLTGEIIVVIASGLVIYVYYQIKQGWKDFRAQLKGGLWLVLYMAAMAGVSFVGGEAFGGLGYLPPVWDQVVVGIMGYIFYRWGVSSAWLTHHVRAAIETHADPLHPPQDGLL